MRVDAGKYRVVHRPDLKSNCPVNTSLFTGTFLINMVTWTVCAISRESSVQARRTRSGSPVILECLASVAVGKTTTITNGWLWGKDGRLNEQSSQKTNRKSFFGSRKSLSLHCLEAFEVAVEQGKDL